MIIYLITLNGRKYDNIYKLYCIFSNVYRTNIRFIFWFSNN
uniref:Cytochrome b6-f complex subunit VI n=1 Tax=Thorea hispida TaxID=202687 RepID=A0A1Z1XAM3_9FLOR|nr:cytochrome b6-f complex subunit VI [Thorea hispida]